MAATSTWNASPVWEAAIPRLFPGQEVTWRGNAGEQTATVRCVLGCPHKNGDQRASLRLFRDGGYHCLAFGAKGSLKDLVCRVLGEDAWRELGRLGSSGGSGGRAREKDDLDASWAQMLRESEWSDRYWIAADLASRYLRSGSRWRGDLSLQTAVGIFDALGRLVGIKARLPRGCQWPSGERTAKYRASPGSRLKGVVFMGERVAAAPAATVVVCAGEKDALVAASHLDPSRWCPVSGCTGEGDVPASLPELVAGRRVVVAYDPDEPGRRGAAKVARAVARRAASVAVASFPPGDGPPGEGKWDSAAVVLHAGPASAGRALEEILEAATPWTGEADSGDGAPPPGEDDDEGLDTPRELPRIALSPVLRDMVDAAESAMGASGEDVFHRGGQLVRVLRTETAAAISPLPEPTLLEVLSSVATWVRETEDGCKQVPPPRDVVRALAARGQWPRLRRLEAVVRGPVLRADGTVLDQPGYDPATACVLDPLPGVTWPTIAARPTKDEAAAALARLASLVDEFPFVDPADRSAWLALILTLVARPAIDGPVPMFLTRSPTPGSGKTLLLAVANTIGTEAPELATYEQVVEDEAEEQKRILAMGMTGKPFVVIDNIEKPLGSAVLARALTSRLFAGRPLGTNAQVEVALPVFGATGNNVVVRSDLARRVIPIDIDPRMESPEDRDGFRVADLERYALEHRAELRGCALTVLRWYCAEGRPQAPCKGLGSYVAWSALVRQALLWLGQPDPIATMQRLRADGDVELEAMRMVLSSWWTTWGDAEKTSLDVASSAGETLRLALSSMGGAAHGLDNKLEPKKLGYVFRRLAGRVVSGYRLERCGASHNSVQRWRVVNAAAPTRKSGRDGVEVGDGDGAGVGGGDLDAWESGRE